MMTRPDGGRGNKNAGYRYEDLRPEIFTEEGQVKFLKIRDNVKHLLQSGGAFVAGRAFAGVTGSSWFMMACLDRLVELGEIQELKTDGWDQFRVFVPGKGN